MHSNVPVASSKGLNDQGLPFVTVIMPIRNEEKTIRACIAEILAQEYPADRLEVVAADGLSSDGTRDILQEVARQDPRLRVIDNPLKVTPAGLNHAILAARGQVIIRLDGHSKYSPNYVSCCVQVLGETGSDNVGGPWVAEGATFVEKAIAASFASPFAVGGARGHDKSYEGPIDTVYLGCWPIKTFEKYGLFDEAFTRNQDDEHNLRISRGGGLIWQSPRIMSRYSPRSSLSGLFKQYLQYGYWKVKVLRKHHIPASLRHIVPGGVLFAMALLGFFALFAPYARAAFLAIAGAYGIAVVLAALMTAVRYRLVSFPLLCLIFPCYHFGYGLGFLAGLMDQVFGRQAGAVGRWSEINR